jgi:preprotein translocase subunit SecD
MQRSVVAMGLLSGALACGTSSPAASPAPDFSQVPVSIEFRLARSAPTDAFVKAMVHSTGDPVYLSPEAEIDNQHIAKAEAVEHPPGLYVDLWLTEAGRRRFAEVKAKHVGEHMALLINKKVLGPPPVIAASPVEVVEESITPMPLTVSLPLDPDRAKQLVAAVARTWPTGEP